MKSEFPTNFKESLKWVFLEDRNMPKSVILGKSIGGVLGAHSGSPLGFFIGLHIGKEIGGKIHEIFYGTNPLEAIYEAP